MPTRRAVMLGGLAAAALPTLPLPARAAPGRWPGVREVRVAAAVPDGALGRLGLGAHRVTLRGAALVDALARGQVELATLPQPWLEALHRRAPGRFVCGAMGPGREVAVVPFALPPGLGAALLYAHVDTLRPVA